MDQTDSLAGRVLITIVTFAPLIFYAVLLVIVWRRGAGFARTQGDKQAPGEDVLNSNWQSCQRFWQYLPAIYYECLAGNKASFR